VLGVGLIESNKAAWTINIWQQCK